MCTWVDHHEIQIESVIWNVKYYQRSRGKRQLLHAELEPWHACMETLDLHLQALSQMQMQIALR